MALGAAMGAVLWLAPDAMATAATTSAAATASTAATVSTATTAVVPLRPVRRQQAPRPATTIAPPPPDLWRVADLTAADWEALRGGKLRTQAIQRGNREGAMALFWLPQPVTAVWALFRDYPRYAEWMSGMKSVNSVDWLDEATVVVGFSIDSPLKTVSYRLLREHRPGPPEWAIRWARVDGDLEHIDGGFSFTPAFGGTLVRYDTFVVIGRWVPEFVRRFFTVRGLKQLTEDVRAAAARAAP